jgi:hypothetical protein
MRIGRNSIVTAGVVFFLNVASTVGLAVGIGDAEGWERSAESRNENAAALETEAAALLESATELRGRDYLYEAERRSNLERAGDAELRTGELEVAAAIHCEKAAENWKQAEGVYAALGETEKQGNAAAMATAALDAAKLALTQAIGCFESATDAFSESNAASEKSEQLAAAKAEQARSSLAEML